MNNMYNAKLGILTSVFLFLFFPWSVCFATENKTSVSDRELLMLSIMSYHNEQNVDVADMTEDEDFRQKWFAGYTDASELKGWKMVDSIINTSIKKMSGFSVVTYKKDNNVVIAFRGTDSGVAKENWGYFILKNEHPQAKYVEQYISSLRHASFINYDTNIYLTGHSLGGYLATFALGKITGIKDLKDKVVKTTTFNGLGIGYTKDKAMLKRLNNIGEHQLVNYAVSGDVVVLIGKHFTKIKYVDFTLRPLKNSIKFLSNPHFPYNFLVQKPFLINDTPEI